VDGRVGRAVGGWGPGPASKLDFTPDLESKKMQLTVILHGRFKGRNMNGKHNMHMDCRCAA
jgi:hypothetical protein